MTISTKYVNNHIPYKWQLKIKSVELVHEVIDLENDFVDVVVRDTMAVITPTNLLKVMNDNSVNFIKPEEPLIIVKQLTQQFIEAAINEYALNDGYWLKLHQFADTMDVSILNNLLEEHRKELETFD